MKHASTDRPPAGLTIPATRRGRPSLARGAGLLFAATLVMASCGFGGDDDDGDSAGETTAPSATTVAPTTVAAATTTTVAPTTTTTLVLVTEGATVMVANASGINGAAGRMTEQLAVVGFSTADAANSTEGQLETTKIYYDADNEDAEAVASSVRDALGGGDITVEQVSTPPPVDTGELGDASVLVAMGNDTADKTLEELQGVAPAPSTDGDDAGTEATETTDAETTETTDAAG